MDYNHPVFKEYAVACKNLKPYFQNRDTPETKELLREYKKKIDALRNYLDIHKHKMPLPKYFYDKDDKTTWRYLDAVVKEEGKERVFVGYVTNSVFSYGDN